MEEGYFETDLRGNLTFVNNALMHIGEVDDIEKLINLNYRVFAPPKSAKKRCLWSFTGYIEQGCLNF